MNNLTFVHGFSHNNNYFGNQVKYFEKTNNIFNLDLIGHGQNKQVVTNFGIKECAVNIVEQLKNKGIHRTKFWGSHTGGGVGIYLAIHFPRLIDKLILEAPVIPGHSMKTVIRAVEDMRRIFTNRDASEAIANWFNTSDWFSYIRSNPRECRSDEHFELLSQFNCSNVLGEGVDFLTIKMSVTKLTSITCPIYIYNGEYDVGEFLDVAKLINKNTSSSQTHVIKNAGGFPAWERPHIVNEYVNSIL